jgi:predicted dinucleotide-utilizing enzyme
VGIVGLGKIGQYLLEQILSVNNAHLFELAFVWNRSFSKVLADERILPGQRLEHLDDFASKKADLIIEVSHPAISKTHGVKFMASGADYIVGSPTCFADVTTEAALLTAADDSGSSSGLYVPAGALWGAPDIQKLSKSGRLEGLTVTMKKHPGEFESLDCFSTT